VIGYSGESGAFESRARADAFTEDDTPTAFSDTMRAAFASTRREELSDSSARAFQASNDKRAQVIKSLGGDANKATFYTLLPETAREDFRQRKAAGKPLEDSPYWKGLAPMYRDAWTEVENYRAQFPDKVLSDERMFEEFKKEAAALRPHEQDTMRRGSGWASFLGSGGAIFTDPLVLATLPLGGGAVGGGRGILATAGRTAAIEGGIGFATEIPIQMSVHQFKQELEAPWTFKDSAMNVLTAGLGGAALGGVVGGGTVAAQRVLERFRTAREAGQVITPEMEEAARKLEETVRIQEENPLEVDGVPPTQVEQAHERILDTARAQEQAGMPIDVESEVRGIERLDELDRTGARIEDPAQLLELDPLTLKTDAQTFQFKQGGNAEGVTEALRDVDAFDRRLAGVSLVWERADGTRFIADGHQRLGLAQRALAAGQDPAEVRLNGFLLREADGISAIDARRIAAVKNMAEGSGTALDAAKILRDAGKFGEALLPPLPPRSALVKQARGLAQLDEQAFRAVINEVIPANLGAMVGRASADPKLQEAMIEVLRRAKPANENQALAIVDQVKMQGVETRTTEDLFGEQSFSESLYLERAQVLDEAMRASGKDSAVFGRLVAEEGRIEQTGANRLDREANQARVQEAQDVRAKLSALANSRGSLSDALTAAARSVREGEQPGRAAAAFLQAARREILEGDRAGRTPGRTRPRSEAARARQVEEGEQPPPVDAAPRSIVSQATDEHAGTPTASRTGTVPDEDYAHVMSAYQDLVDKQGALARVADEVNGQVELRSVRNVIEELDLQEQTLERIRLCSAPTREVA
jgi:hypothetical protein